MTYFEMQSPVGFCWHYSTGNGSLVTLSHQVDKVAPARGGEKRGQWGLRRTCVAFLTRRCPTFVRTQTVLSVSNVPGWQTGRTWRECAFVSLPHQWKPLRSAMRAKLTSGQPRHCTALTKQGDSSPFKYFPYWLAVAVLGFWRFPWENTTHTKPSTTTSPIRTYRLIIIFTDSVCVRV